MSLGLSELMVAIIKTNDGFLPIVPLVKFQSKYITILTENAFQCVEYTIPINAGDHLSDACIVNMTLIEQE